jgi:hypothetical protein
MDYENDHWGEWHILREFISNALDSVGGDTDKLSIHSDNGFAIIKDNGVGYPLVYAKRIGATSKKEDAAQIGNFGEGTKLALLSCVRKDIQVYLASRNWLIEPKSVVIEGQKVLMYDIYETTESISGTTIVIEDTEKVSDIISNLDRYFLQFRTNDDCLHGSTVEGIYPIDDQSAQLFNKGVYVKTITSLYSYAVSLRNLNRDRDLISHTDIASAVCDIWQKVDNTELIKTLIQASTSPYQVCENLVELHYPIYPRNLHVWAVAFKELYGADALLYTDSFAEREAVALGYKVINCDYRIASILRSAGIRNDTETLADDYEFKFSDELGVDEAATLDKVYTIVDLLEIQAPKNVKIFDSYMNHSSINGLYNRNKGQVYLRRDILSSGLEQALHVYLHETNHHISGSDDLSREFANNLCRMLTSLLLRYSVLCKRQTLQTTNKNSPSCDIIAEIHTEGEMYKDV